MDVLLRRNSVNGVDTSVYRKITNTDIYINWHSYSPKSWKISTFKTLVKRAFLISSNESLLQAELTYLTDVFCNLNQYPKNLLRSIVEKETLYSRDRLVETNNCDNDTETNEVITITLPYGENKGNK